MPSTVTCRSSIGSSSAAWVRGGVRLISSTSTTFANTGPGRKRKEPSCWSYTLIPERSEGSRSGVDCTRVNHPPIDVASARASVVLPTPGTPSSSRLPSANRHRTAVPTASSLPAITRRTLSTTRRYAWAAAPVSTCGSITLEASTLRLERLSPNGSGGDQATGLGARNKNRGGTTPPMPSGHPYEPSPRSCRNGAGQSSTRFSSSSSITSPCPPSAVTISPSEWFHPCSTPASTSAVGSAYDPSTGKVSVWPPQ